MCMTYTRHPLFIPLSLLPPFPVYLSVCPLHSSVKHNPPPARNGRPAYPHLLARIPSLALPGASSHSRRFYPPLRYFPVAARCLPFHSVPRRGCPAPPRVRTARIFSSFDSVEKSPAVLSSLVFLPSRAHPHAYVPRVARHRELCLCLAFSFPRLLLRANLPRVPGFRRPSSSARDYLLSVVGETLLETRDRRGEWEARR